jgi:GTPase SAR1 family protein
MVALMKLLTLNECCQSSFCSFQILVTGKTCLLLVRDFLFKVVIIGDSAAGKSSILYRFVDNKFDPTFMSTIGIDYKFKYVGEERRKKGGERERRERWERRERREGRQEQLVNRPYIIVLWTSLIQRPKI